MNIRFGLLVLLLSASGCATSNSPVMREAEIAALKADVLTRRETFVFGGRTLQYRIHSPRTKFLRRYPLVLFLHGSGERGHDNERQLVHGMTDICRYALRHGDAFVVAPQCPDGEKWSDADWSRSSMSRTADPTPTMASVLALVDDLVRRFPVDPDRVYVTGLSMGGFGAWDAASRRPDLFGAVMPICGGVDEKTAALYRGMNVRFFHGENDPAVSVEYSRRMHRALEDAGVAHGYTEYPHASHDVWSRTYANDAVLAWMFNCRR